MVKTLKFGINFVDRKIDLLPENGIYLFSDESLYLKSYFVYSLIQCNVLRNNSCLYITNYPLMDNNDILKKKFMEMSDYDHLSILEIPLFIRDCANNPNDTKNYIDDLNVYVDSIKPDIIIIQNIELFLCDESKKINTTSLSKFMNYFHKLGITIIIDVSNFEKKDYLICEKFTIGVFEFYADEKNDNHRLDIMFPRNVMDNLSIIFSIDVDDTIIVPRSKNISSITLGECKQIVMQPPLQHYENVISEIFSHDIEFLYYDSYEQLQELKFDSKLSLIIITTHTNNVNGALLISWVRKNYPLIKIIYTGSIYVPAYQKIRAIKLGADKYLSLPIRNDELKMVLNELYHREFTEESKILQHQILYVKKDFIRSNKFTIIYKNTLFKFIKDYSFTAVKQGDILHFIKFFTKINSFDKLPDVVRNSNNLIFISSYYFENHQALLFIFKDLYTIELDKIINSLKIITEMYIDENDLGYQDINQQHFDNVQKINFPIEQTNIDEILEWVHNE